MSKTRPETKCDNKAAEKLKPWQRIRNRASTKSNRDFCWFLDPKQRFFYKIQLFLGWLLRVYLNQVFSAYIYIAGGFPWFGFCRSAGCPRPQQKWGWVFGFCRPGSFLFRCYVFGFVEAAFVFSRNASTKSEAPTPPGQFLEVLKLCEQNGLHMFKWLGRPRRKTFSEVV